MRRLRWKLLSQKPDLAHQLGQKMGLPSLFAQLLINRGVEDEREAEEFLYPSLKGLKDPFLMKGMEEGVQRMVRAISRREKVMIFGDYDVDGITSTALLKIFLREAGLDPLHYIPSRLEEGYGLSAQAVKRAASMGVSLLVTVDCGITNFQEVKLARETGMDVIIIDHHHPPALLPPTTAIINPLQRDCPFPFKGLAAAGVVFFFLMALRRTLREVGHWERGEPNLKRMLDLVALGTVADIVPLTGENRTLVYFGLKELQEGRRPGIAALKEVSGLGPGEIDYGHVAFCLAPRINAGGRMGKEELGLRLLLAEELQEARKIAMELELVNRERQMREEEVYSQAKEMIQEMELGKGIVLSSPQWHPGVIGIVASRIAEEFWRPTILISLSGDEGKGSARSIPEFHLYEGLKRCEEHLISFGGHRSAAGLKVLRERIPLLERAFDEAIREALGDEELLPTLYIDAEVELDEMDAPFIQNLPLLAPHGPANPRPLLSSRYDLTIEEAKAVGKESLKLRVRDERKAFEVIGFGMGELLESIPPKAKVAFSPSLEEWNGMKRLQLELRALKWEGG